MEDFTIQQGETLRLTVTVTEDGADTAELYAENSSGDSIQTLVSFDGLVADLTTNTDPNQPAGVYNYFIRIVWDDGSVDILTKNDNCEDEECEMPTITVCEILSESS
jgi:hypothetical protein